MWQQSTDVHTDMVATTPSHQLSFALPYLPFRQAAITYVRNRSLCHVEKNNAFRYIYVSTRVSTYDYYMRYRIIFLSRRTYQGLLVNVVQLLQSMTVCATIKQTDRGFCRRYLVPTCSSADPCTGDGVLLFFTLADLHEKSKKIHFLLFIMYRKCNND